METLHTENGFTLIEALVAMVVLTIGILALSSMQIRSVGGNADANSMTTASTWNADQLEAIVGLQYSDATLADTDGDGNGSSQMNSNGVDTNGNNFGLDDVQCCNDGNDPAGNAVAGCTAKADGCANKSGDYYIYWNVAVDVPMKNLKTICVHVKDNAQRLSVPVTFTYIKDDII